MANITLSKKNFFHNLNLISEKTKSKDKIALVLKDNAYGHGLLEIASMAQEYGITKAVVKNEFEAKQVKSYFKYILILADNPQNPSENFIYTINDIEAIQNFPSCTRVELKVDTGMHRNGIAPQELLLALKQIKKHKLHLEAIFTHHRSADELTSEWFWQKENFASVKEQARIYGCGEVNFHSCNSAALFREENFDEDMARVGIAAYGCLEMPSAYEIELKPVLSLYADRLSSRKLNKGEALGYGATFTAKNSCVVSNYNFGYGDGFLRVCSNNYTSPEGFSLVGRISMDNSSFVSDEKKILLFKDAREIAKFAQTISYEILTSLKADIKREIV